MECFLILTYENLRILFVLTVLPCFAHGRHTETSHSGFSAAKPSIHLRQNPLHLVHNL